jgi:hypothetical protein
MAIKSKFLGGLVLVVMFGGIMLTSVLGLWNTGTSKEPSLIIGGEAAGKPNPADIRGSYSFGDIEKGFGVPVKDMKTAFRLPEETDGATFQVKGLETLYEAEAAAGKEIGADSMRLFVADYAGLPFTISSDIYLPAAAVEMLKARGSLTAEQVQYLNAHSIAGESGAAPAVETGTTPASKADSSAPAVVKTEPPADAKVISGSTTFQQVLDWGVPQSAIEAVIGGAMPDPSGVIKDYITGKGLEFFSYKQKLQAEVDKGK